jgi:hypothetical protein
MLPAELPMVLNNGRWKERTTMATPITGGTAFDFGAAAQAAPAQQQTTTTPAASVHQPTGTGDTVKISDGAQVRLLKTLGQTVAEIAVNTALSTQTVNSYLGITQAPPTVATSGK